MDDLLLISKQPELIIEPLKEVFGYELKGVGGPEYYNGGNMEFDKKQECWTMSAKSYIKSTAENIEELFDVTLKNYDSPLEAGDNPKLDESDFLPPGEFNKYQMMIGCAQWAVTLGRFDIMFATNTLA